METIGIIENPQFKAATPLKWGRAVTLTHSTQTVAYTTAGAVPTHYTVGNSSKKLGFGQETVAVARIDSIEGVQPVEFVGAPLVQGDELEVGADGCFQKRATGTASGLRVYMEQTGKVKGYIGAYRA